MSRNKALPMNMNTPPTPRKIQRYGWKPDLPDFRDKVYRLHSTASLPTHVDLTPHMPPVYDQGDLGSCTGNAIAGAIEYQYNKEGHGFVAPSRLFIYFNEREVEGTINEDSGAQIRDGIKVVASYGVCPEKEWPYVVSKYKVKPSVQCYTDALKEKVVTYSSVNQNLVHFKDALSSGFPIVIGFTVYSAFEDESVAESGILNMPAADETVVGGHAVLVVGYDDSKQMFLVRNSWGASWGLKGYFWMPYAYLMNPNLASDFWAIKLVQ